MGAACPSVAVGDEERIVDRGGAVAAGSGHGLQKRTEVKREWEGRGEGQRWLASAPWNRLV